MSWNAENICLCTEIGPRQLNIMLVANGRFEVHLKTVIFLPVAET